MADDFEIRVVVRHIIDRDKQYEHAKRSGQQHF
jgi:hypothetical protein